MNSYDDKILLYNTNRMLSLIGINAKRIYSIDELKRVASSMVVAIYESLLNEKIPGVIRFPQALADYETNAQLVIDALCSHIHMDLQHITGVAITEGNLRAISNLINIFSRIANITGRKEGSETITEDQAIDEIIGNNLGLSLSFESVTQVIKSNERKLKQMDKLERARVRRESIIKSKEASSHTANSLKSKKSNLIRIAQKEKDFEDLNRSICLESANQEFVMLRKVYSQLLRKLREWYREDKAQAKEAEIAANKEIYDYVLTLQNSFDSRVAQMKETSASDSIDSRNSILQNRKLRNGLKVAVKEEYDKLFEKCRSSSILQKQLHELTKKQGFETLMEYIQGDNNWSNSLRDYH